MLVTELDLETIRGTNRIELQKKKTGNKKHNFFMDCKNQKLSEGSASTKKIKVNKTK
jgi:hypothetical protein